MSQDLGVRSASGQARVGAVATSMALLLFVLLVLAQGAQAWVAWQRGTTGLAAGIGPGALCSVQLLNGQVYYGELVGNDATQVTLRDVYYVQAAIDPTTNQPAGNRLVSRSKADWHAPTLTTVPADKILMIERVGPESRVARLVAEDRAAGAKR